MNAATWNRETLQTGIRIQNSQFKFWAVAALLSWLLCTMFIGVLTLARYDRKHVVVWLIANWRPGSRPVYMNGEPYNKEKLARWLNAEVYHGTPKQWIGWALWCGLLPVGLGALVWWYRTSIPAPTETHIRGTQVFPKAEFQRRLRANKKAPGVTIAGVAIPRELERSHVMVAGATGSGKTVTMRRMLREVQARGEIAIVLDPDLEYTPEFFNPDRGDWLLNPLDARWPGWDPWSECVTPADMVAEAASVFPITPGMAGPDPYYSAQARKIYQAILEKAPFRDPRRIPDLLRDPMDLLAVIAGTDGALALGAKDTDKRHGILQKLSDGLTAFRFLAPGSRPWSAREWVKNKQGWVFLTFRETDKEAVLPVLSLWLDGLARRLLAEEINPAETTWVFADEFRVLRAQLNLVELLNRARKRGVACVLGFQDVLQLYPIYGQALTQNMLNQPETAVLLRTKSPATQEWCSAYLSEREVARHVESQTVGPENVRDSITRRSERKTEAAVIGAEFKALPLLTGYVSVAEYGVAKVSVEYAPMVKNQPVFIERVSEKNKLVLQSIQKGSTHRSRL